MVEQIIYHSYPDNMDKLIINALITDAKINPSRLQNNPFMQPLLDRLEELEVMEYVTSATLDDGSVEYYPSTRFQEELKINQDEQARLEAIEAAREAEQQALLEEERKKQEEAGAVAGSG